MNRQEIAEKTVARMLERDAFSRWLGIELVDLAPGRAVVRMTTRDEMLNGFGVCHGGVVYAVADSAFAFATNSDGKVTVSITTSMSHPAPVLAGDTLTATSEEEAASRRIAYHAVRVTNQRDEVVALFRGTAYRTERILFDPRGEDGSDD